MGATRAPKSLRFDAAINSVDEKFDNYSGRRASAVASLIAVASFSGGAADAQNSLPPVNVDAPVERPVVQETTALGAAWLAGHKAGVWPDADGFGKLWKLDRAFSPTLAAAVREKKYAGWKRSVEAVLAHASG